MILPIRFLTITALLCVVLLHACSDSPENSTQLNALSSEPIVAATPDTEDYTRVPQKADFIVYKSPTCGCCSDWISHLEDNGYSAEAAHPDDLSAVKLAWGVTPELQSCHTAVSRQGYLFEGHIPAHVIQRFLAERPANAMGLVVPGMPVGSPGMEFENKFEAYDVLLLRKDGRTELFTRITKP